jgi:kynureninase
MIDDLRAYERSLALRSRCLGEWVERFEEMHQLTERLLEAPRGTVLLRDSATAVQAAVAASLEPTGERRRVVVARSDFHSSRYLWQAQARRGFEIVDVSAEGESLTEAAVRAIDERTRVVALSLVSPRTGALLDARRVADKAHAKGALFVLDAYQAVGAVPTRVVDLGADVVVGGYHKWLGGGGTGLAFGYVSPLLSSKLEASYPGWIAHRDLLAFADRFTPASGARKLQQGMPAMEPVYTARAGLLWALEAGIDAIRARSLSLTARLFSRAREEGLRVRTPEAAAERGGMICIDLEDAAAIVSDLAARGIDVDARPGSGIRVGPHPCVTPEECDAVIRAIAARAR